MSTRGQRISLPLLAKFKRLSMPMIAAKIMWQLPTLKQSDSFPRAVLSRSLTGEKKLWAATKRQSTGATQYLNTLAASFISSVTVASTENQDLIARNGEYSPFSALKNLLPEVIVRSLFRLQFNLFDIYSYYRFASRGIVCTSLRER